MKECYIDFGYLLLEIFTYFSVFIFFVHLDLNWSISDDAKKSNMDEGLLTAKVFCLIEVLLEYRYECCEKLFSLLIRTHLES